MMATFPDHIKAQLNTISRWDEATLQGEIVRCNREAQFYSIMATTTRIVSVVLGLTMLATLGMLNPFYFPITLSMLMYAYHPFMSMAYHPFIEWAQAAWEEADKYETIIQELQQDVAPPFKIPNHHELGMSNALFSRVISAQYRALEAQKKPLAHPQLDHLRETYHQGPNEEGLRNIYHAEFELCVWKHTNIRIRIQQAYLLHVANHPFDQRSLLDFGKYQPLPIKHVMALKEEPISVFLLSSGLSIDHLTIVDDSLFQVEQKLFNP